MSQSKLTSNFLSLVNEIEQKLLETNEISGTDTNDRIYSDIKGMWEYELTSKPNNNKKKQSKKQKIEEVTEENEKKENEWYTKAYDYWESEENCPVSDDGVLGGFGFLTEVDVRDSNQFLDSILSIRPNSLQNVADCGAGIGRVTKNFLLPRCAQVDLVEQSPRLLESSRQYIGPESVRTRHLCLNLRDFVPPPNSYDMIWIQWVVGHLHDEDFVQFFRNCINGLRSNGVVVLKDNCCDDWTFVVDKNDSSISRSPEYMKVLFDLAGCHLLLVSQQTNFPPELSSVYMFALVPSSSSSSAPSSSESS